MKKWNLRQLLFLMLCCDIGLFSKRLLSPVTILITDALRIPDGMSTGFSLMFLVVAAALVPGFGCAALMGAVQSMLAFALGMVGAMGALAPISYILPGLVIDLVLLLTRRTGVPVGGGMVAANALGSITACAAANVLVMHLPGKLLWLYLGTAGLSGMLFGLLGIRIWALAAPILGTGGGHG